MFNVLHFCERVYEKKFHLKFGLLKVNIFKEVIGKIREMLVSEVLSVTKVYVLSLTCQCDLNGN